MTLSPDLLALGFVVAPVLIGAAIAVVQSKYYHEKDQKPRQEPSFSYRLVEPKASDRKEPTFDQI